MRPFILVVLLAIAPFAAASTIIPFSQPDPIASAPLETYAPDIAVSGDVSLVIWQTYASSRLVGVRIGADGSRLDAFPFTIAERTGSGSVVGTSEGFVVFVEGRSVFVGRDGKIGSFQSVGSAGCPRPKIASAGDRILVLAPAYYSVQTTCASVSTLLDARGNPVVRDLGTDFDDDSYIVFAGEGSGFVLFRATENRSARGTFAIGKQHIDKDGVATPWKSIANAVEGGIYAAAFDGTNDIVISRATDGWHAAAVTGNDTLRDLGVVAPPATGDVQVAPGSDAVWIAYVDLSVAGPVIVTSIRGGRIGPSTTLLSGPYAVRIAVAGDGVRVVYVNTNGAIESQQAGVGNASLPITLSTASAAQLDVHTATNGVIRAAAWRERMDRTHGRIAVGGLNPDGSRIGPFFLTATGGNPSCVGIARGTSGFLVTSIEPRDHLRGTLQAMRLDNELHPIDAIPISIEADVPLDQNATIASDGSQWLVIFVNGKYELVASRVTEQGFLADPVPFVIARPGYAASRDWNVDALRTGSQFVIVYTFRGVWGPPVPGPHFNGAAVVNSDGSIRASFPLPADAVALPHIAFDGSAFLFAWPAALSTKWMTLPPSLNAEPVMRSRVTARQRAIMELSPAHQREFQLRAIAGGFEVTSVVRAFENGAWFFVIRTTTISTDGQVISDGERRIEAPVTFEAIGDILTVNGVPSITAITPTSGAPYGDTVRAFWLLP